MKRDTVNMHVDNYVLCRIYVILEFCLKFWDDNAYNNKLIFKSTVTLYS